MSTSLTHSVQDSSEVFSGVNHSTSPDNFPPLDLESLEDNGLSQEKETLALNLLRRETDSSHNSSEENAEESSGFSPQLAAAIDQLAPPGEGALGTPKVDGRSLAGCATAKKTNRSLLYRAEMESGLRLKSGAKKLKGLKGPHYMCISLHLAGIKHIEIASLCRKSVTWVCRTLGDPLAKAEIVRRSIMLDSNLFALQGKVVDALRDALTNSAEPAIQLRAAEQWFKVHGRFQQAASGETFSAEDLVKKVLERQNVAQAQAVVHVHVGEKERPTILIEGSN